MDHPEMQTLTLFDLLAREWTLSSAVVSATFNVDQSAVAFACNDGSLAVAALADPESPTSRIRADVETGQTTIRPRSEEVRPIVTVAPPAETAVPLAFHRESGFIAGGHGGEMFRIAADGDVTTLDTRMKSRIAAVDHHAESTQTAVAAGDEVMIITEGDDAHSWILGQSIKAVSISPKGSEVAAAHPEGLSIWENGSRRDLPFPGAPNGISWSPFGDWIACPLEAGGLQIVRLSDGATSAVSGFPTPVNTVSWSRKANALVASGAFRAAAWSMSAPPLDGETKGALETGRAGMVVVEAVAAHPKRDLLAVGYANGLTNIVRIGHRDELMIRPDGRGAVTALAWSDDGSHLAIGGADGTAAIVTFPPNMFK